MSRTTMTTLMVVLAAGLAGCSQPMPGRSRSLGTVQWEAAFASAREVLAQYYSIAEADPTTGVIRTRPKPVEARGPRLLGDSPARQLATLRLGRKDGQVTAQLSIALQREGSAEHQQMNPARDSYDSVPNRTPAEIEAATTADQNEVWRTERYDHVLERQILDDVYRTLHGSGPE